jgi:hypothetical protein
MQKRRALWIISLIMSFVLAAFGCATGKPVSGKSRQSVNVGLKAEAAPEGISLTFGYIPPETTRLFIGVEKGEHSPPANPHDVIF